MVFALDKKDVLGCAGVSKIAARLRDGNKPTTMLFQLVWKNAELGFKRDQELFFEVSSKDVAELVDAVYSAGGTRERSLTSGVPALRVLEEIQNSPESVTAEDFADSEYAFDGFDEVDNSSKVFKSTGEDDDFLDDTYVQVKVRGGSVTHYTTMAHRDVVMVPHDSFMISPREANRLVDALPERLRECRWKLVYDFVRSGVSLHAFYTACNHYKETLLIVRDVDTKQICGGFASDSWDPAMKMTGFYGNGECFVFRLNRTHDDGEGTVEKFGWSGSNEFFQMSSASHMAWGGGGNFALCLDDDFHCSSGPCPTFAGLEQRGLCLNSSFKADAVELWAFESQTRARGNSLVEHVSQQKQQQASVSTRVLVKKASNPMPATPLLVNVNVIPIALPGAAVLPVPPNMQQQSEEFKRL